MVTKAQAKHLEAARAALAAHLKTATSTDVESLARSFGLPVNQVEKMVEARNA